MAISDEMNNAEVDEILADPRFTEFLEQHRGGVPERDQDKLMLASGIPEIKRALSRAIETGSGARFIERAKVDTSTQIAALKAVAHRPVDVRFPTC